MLGSWQWQGDVQPPSPSEEVGDVCSNTIGLLIA